MVQHGSRQDCRGFTGFGIEEKHEIDVGIGGEFSTAIAAQGHQAAMLRPGKGHRLIRFADGIPIAADDESIDQLRKRADNFGARDPVEQALTDGTAAVRQQRPVSFHIERFEHAAPRSGGRHSTHSAVSPVSPVRIRTTSLKSRTTIFPSPMLPVLAVRAMVSSTRATCGSATATSILTFGTNSIVYSVPRYVSLCPFWRPNPFTSVTVIHCTPISSSASFTSSSLKGLMTASTNFMSLPPALRRRYTATEAQDFG